MMLETIRLLTDALNNESYGVNAQLASGSYGSDPQPPNVIAVDETRDANVALDRPHPVSPSLEVAIQAPTEFEGEVMTTYRDGTVEVAIRYSGRESLAQVGNANAHYTNKAILRTVREWMRNENLSDRQLNQVSVMSVEAISVVTVAQDVDGDKRVFGGVVLNLRCRDDNP